MLQHIKLDNFTIIEQLELDLDFGMTVITGETGAGKSIIIDAIELALGSRLDGNVIRSGANRCDINLLFNISNNINARNWLVAHELTGDDEQCLIRRSISQEGRSSRCFVNGQPITLQNLADFAPLLLNIHGQHQHQSLLKREQQRNLVDAYGGHLTLAAEVKKLYQHWSNTHDKITQLSTLNSEQISRREFLSYQLNELQTLALKENEVVLLEALHKQLANADSLISQCSHALLLLADQDENCVLKLLQNAMRGLQNYAAHHPHINNCLSLLTTSIVHIEEARDELKNYLQHIENNPHRLQEIEERLASIHDIARKHRVPAEQLVDLQIRLQNELNELDNCEQEIALLEQNLQELERNYFIAAAKLSCVRKKESEILSQLVTDNMQALGMTGGQFSISVINDEGKQPLPHGLEKIEFYGLVNQQLAPAHDG